ncbi:LacI family DNA-binding transcriptional regulator [Tessaracoccus rhinocerotis]|uniref:LacI family DNA-binding transcriptional regulator n=1 Tax=Tessaracoccus rhinocerotis TaxID=1689449 RepID=UPI00163DE5E5|nr:LacI family DNA-binding transcriptional regulator [Tessaracoccus rhinocerotis]
MAATADDVARAAGVSVSTVSRALSAPQKVAPDTRLRVVQAAETLRYRPSRAARDLATGRTNNIGLVIPDLENPYFSSLTKAFQSGAHMQGYQLFVIDTDEDATREPEVLGRLAGDVDGIILCSPRAADDQLLAVASEVRVVTTNRRIPGIASVLIDEAGSMGQAMRHLVALGHRQIAYAGGPLTSWSDQHRRAAFTAFGEADDGVALHDLGSFLPYFSGGVAAADLLLATPATAVIAFNDLMALGLLDRIKSRGVEVPRQMSIASFDNTMFASAVTPHLTSVDFPRRMLARHALELLLSRGRPAAGSAGEESPSKTLTTQLTIRASSGPAPETTRSPRTEA